MMAMPDFMESDSVALSQILRSVAPPGAAGGGGAPPLVRVVRGTGAEGRWTEVRQQCAAVLACTFGVEPRILQLIVKGLEPTTL